MKKCQAMDNWSKKMSPDFTSYLTNANLLTILQFDVKFVEFRVPILFLLILQIWPNLTH